MSKPRRYGSLDEAIDREISELIASSGILETHTRFNLLAIVSEVLVFTRGGVECAADSETRLEIIKKYAL